MRVLLPIIVGALSLSISGCSHDMVAPSDPIETLNPDLRVYVAGYVVTAQHQCIVGAVVDILDSSDRSLTGRRMEQCECDFDNGLGYDFGSVPAGTRVRLRASAVGYQPQQRDVVMNGHASMVFVLIPD